MVIQRVLNNNAIVCLNDHGEEIILKGKGIAFMASPGDVVDENKIEAKFVIENPDTVRRFKEIMVSIPEDYMDTAEEIISLVKSELDTELSDTIYVTLTDHISNLVERVRKGIIFNNTILWDVKRMYKEEYKLGLQAVEIIRRRLDIKLDESEANFIALHIVNAELDVEIKDIYIITEMIDKIYGLVESKFELNISEDDLLYTRFILHLRFFFERLLHQKNVNNNKNKDLLEVMSNKYHDQYEIVDEIVRIVSQRYDNTVTSDEKLYLLIHVVKLTT